MTDDTVPEPAPAARAQKLKLRDAERYGRLYTWAEDLRLPSREHRVLSHLIGAGDKNLSSWWSNEAAAERIGMGVSTFRRGLVGLEKAGLIRRKPRWIPGGRTSDHVTVLAPAKLLVVRQNEAERAASTHEPDAGASRLPMRPVKSTPRINSQPVKLNEKRSDLYEEEIAKRSSVDLTGRPRRRAAGPVPAADVFEQIRGAA